MADFIATDTPGRSSNSVECLTCWLLIGKHTCVSDMVCVCSEACPLFCFAALSEDIQLNPTVAVSTLFSEQTVF